MIFAPLYIYYLLYHKRAFFTIVVQKNYWCHREAAVSGKWWYKVRTAKHSPVWEPYTVLQHHLKIQLELGWYANHMKWSSWYFGANSICTVTLEYCNLICFLTTDYTKKWNHTLLEIVCPYFGMFLPLLVFKSWQEMGGNWRCCEGGNHSASKMLQCVIFTQQSEVELEMWSQQLLVCFHRA